ncbi:hypothetical protein KQI63_06985 [bacterium]|nr:hypothetical protein [bacterium]
MEQRSNQSAWQIAALFGTLAAIGGLLHGVGEVLQGPIPVESVIIESWSTGPLADHMGGDPGMTILPTMLLTGSVGLISSTALLIWSLFFLRRRFAGLIQLLLTIAMLLFGGGFGPPLAGILASIAAFGIRSRYAFWERLLSAEMIRFLARSWPIVFGITAANGLFLYVGHMVMVFIFGFTHPEPFVVSTFLVLITVPLSVFFGMGKELETRIYQVS